MGKIWILFRQVPYEFGEVINCYKDRGVAIADLKAVCVGDPENGEDQHELQEWDMDLVVNLRGARSKRYKVKDGEIIEVNILGERIG